MICAILVFLLIVWLAPMLAVWIAVFVGVCLVLFFAFAMLWSLMGLLGAVVDNYHAVGQIRVPVLDSVASYLERVKAKGDDYKQEVAAEKRKG